MRSTVILVGLVCVTPVFGADLSLYANPCEASLKSEAQFVEDSVLSARDKWRQKVRTAFDAKKLSNSQRRSAEAAFASLVSKMSDDLAKSLSLSGILRTLNMMPVLAPDTCRNPQQLRSLSEQSINTFNGLLENLLPMIDTVSDIARREG
jgi:hypothetical protein